MLLAGRHDRRRRESLIVGIAVLQDVRVADLDLSLEARQPGGAIAEAAPSIVVLAVVPKGADREIRARGQHLARDIGRGRVEFDRLERAAVGKVLGKRTRIRTGVEGQLTDYFYATIKATLLSTRRVRSAPNG
jgi:hypothetical protein